MNINFKEIAEIYVSKEQKILDVLPNYAEKIPAFNIMSVGGLNKESVKKLDMRNVLYFFKINQPSEDSTIQIREQIQGIKDCKATDYKLPLVNKDSNNEVLYVGKSSGLFSGRLKIHLFDDSKQTYGLHLSEWKNDDLKLDLYYTVIDLSDYQGDKSLFLEKLETALHSYLRPILGRIGH